jgi:hypothetical protein
VTNTATVTPTATPTPPSTDVVFKLTILETPIAGAPIQVNAETKITDENGEIATSLVTTSLYTVSSGLGAVSFESLLETGESFGARSPITLAAQRLVSSGEVPCRLVVGGAPYTYFSFVNTSDQSLAVPLLYSPLNTMYSVTGQAVPPEVFGPGTNGFTIAENHFMTGAGLAGRWRFLGQEIEVPAAPEICADRGVPGSCAVIDPETLRIPFNHTRRVIIKLASQSIAAARSGRWRGTGGRFTIPFLSRGAAALKSMEMSFSESSGQNFVCEITPLSCTTKQVPKKALLRAFKRMFEGKVPRGLEHIAQTSQREVATFERQLRKVPDTYTSCE